LNAAFLTSNVGGIVILADEQAVLGLDFVEAVDAAAALQESSRRHGFKLRLSRTPLLAEASRQLQQYFAGERRQFELPLNPAGTAFQKSVWRALSEIPYGETCSYRDIAQRLGQPGAMRAVGGANGANPIPIIIPCHRVIAADGSLGGFSSGLWRKQKLLVLEAPALSLVG
jgi:O-6-methylguanine DNA methyltransferase